MLLADMVKTIRQETGMSQKQLGEMIGSNQTEVSFIERGFIPLNPEKQIAIENIFNEVIKGEKTLKEKEKKIKWNILSSLSSYSSLEKTKKPLI